MARLIYTAITSLDGYVADKGGNFDWAAYQVEISGGASTVIVDTAAAS
jgi:hypothetical protein